MVEEYKPLGCAINGSKVCLVQSDLCFASDPKPSYLAEPADMQKLIRSVRLLLKIAATEPLASHLNPSALDQTLLTASDAELAEVIKKRVESLYHPACTCAMGTSVEAGGVVDAKLRVFGVQGLRVCDASVFPKIVSGHPAAACIAIAEKLADELKNEYGEK